MSIYLGTCQSDSDRYQKYQDQLLGTLKKTQEAFDEAMKGEREAQSNILKRQEYLEKSLAKPQTEEKYLQLKGQYEDLQKTIDQYKEHFIDQNFAKEQAKKLNINLEKLKEQETDKDFAEEQPAKELPSKEAPAKEPITKAKGGGLILRVLTAILGDKFVAFLLGESKSRVKKTEQDQLPQQEAFEPTSKDISAISQIKVMSKIAAASEIKGEDQNKSIESILKVSGGELNKQDQKNKAKEAQNNEAREAAEKERGETVPPQPNREKASQDAQNSWRSKVGGTRARANAAFERSSQNNDISYAARARANSATRGTSQISY